MGSLPGKFAELCRQNIGFALFLAWEYIALYGCAMAIGSFVPYNLEYVWLVSAASSLVVACALLALMRFRPVQVDRRWGVAAMTCAIAGNISLWLSYAVIETFWVMFAVAGVLFGIAIALFMTIWGARLVRCNEARTEFDVVACFIASFALYALTLPIKLYGLVNLAVECLLPPLSAWFAFRERPSDPDFAWGSSHAPDVRVSGAGCPMPELRALRTAFVLIAAQWALVAFFRIVDAPVGSYGRYVRYFIAFVTGFLVSLALFYVLMRVMRYVNLSMSYRWLLPVVMLNVIVLFMAGDQVAGRVAAYAVIHAGMFGMQMSMWIALLKYLRRTGGRPDVVFAGFAAAKGLGILVGCGVGLLAVKNLQGDGLMVAVLVTTCAMVLVIMMTGFNPSWYFVRARRMHGVQPEVPCAQGGLDVASSPSLVRHVAAAVAARMPDVAEGGSQEEDSAVLYDALMRRRANSLRRLFGLTERETEVAELLLCGRSRPYIRDELGISLNTVHAHARSILIKCGVHSQRELIDLPIASPAPVRDSDA